MSYRTNIKSIFFILISIQFFIGCITSREFHGSITDLGDNIVITGSIEITPPLKVGEQNVKQYLRGESLENKILFVLENRIFTKDEIFPINISNIENLVMVEIGKPFYIKQKYNSKLYLSLVFLFKGVYVYMHFPGNYLIEVPAGCNVLYLGKIKYHRDIYNAITKIEIIDDFDSTIQDMQEKYKTKVDMCRVKLQMVKE